MKKNERKRTSILVLAICALLIVVSVAGTYAYYVADIANDEGTNVTLKAKTLSVIFTDGKDISLVDVLPGQKFVKTFTVKNTGTNTVKYDVSIINVLNELNNKNELVYTLEKGTDKVADGLAYPSADAVIADDMNIAAGATDSYILTIEYLNTNSSQNKDMGKTIKGVLNITDVVEVKNS